MEDIWKVAKTIVEKMKQGFRFSDSGRIAYSVYALNRLCKDNPGEAFYHLETGNFEAWLDYIGEEELSEKVYQLRLDNCNRPLKELEEILTSHIRKSQLSQFNKRQSIDIILKEYEMLRGEVIHHLQNRTQLVILGLAAIFTLAGLGLSPLTDFLTAESILIPADISILFDEDSFKVDLETLNDNENIALLERTIKASTIPAASISSVIVFTWLIPTASIYIMYFHLNWSQQSIVIGEYIRRRIERKITMISKNKLDDFKTKTSDEDKDLITHLAWETYMRQDPRSKDIGGITFTCIFFSLIGILSTIGGILILYLSTSAIGEGTALEKTLDEIYSVIELLAWNFASNLCSQVVFLFIILLVFLFLLSKCIFFRKDCNWLWLLALSLLCYFLIISNFIGLFDGVEPSSFWLFLLPSSILTFCLVKTLHQYIYTINMRNKSKEALESKKYLEDLWNP